MLVKISSYGFRLETGKGKDEGANQLSSLVCAIPFFWHSIDIHYRKLSASRLITEWQFTICKHEVRSVPSLPRCLGLEFEEGAAVLGSFSCGSFARCASFAFSLRRLFFYSSPVEDAANLGATVRSEQL